MKEGLLVKDKQYPKTSGLSMLRGLKHRKVYSSLKVFPQAEIAVSTCVPNGQHQRLGSCCVSLWVNTIIPHLPPLPKRVERLGKICP